MPTYLLLFLPLQTIILLDLAFQLVHSLQGRLQRPAAARVLHNGDRVLHESGTVLARVFGVGDRDALGVVGWWGSLLGVDSHVWSSQQQKYVRKRVPDENYILKLNEVNSKSSRVKHTLNLFNIRNRLNNIIMFIF